VSVFGGAPLRQDTSPGGTAVECASSPPARRIETSSAGRRIQKSAEFVDAGDADTIAVAEPGVRQEVAVDDRDALRCLTTADVAAHLPPLNPLDRYARCAGDDFHSLPAETSRFHHNSRLIPWTSSRCSY